MQFFATCAKALEPLVAAELRTFGAVADVVETRAGVAFAGELETAYRACLWSRVASRILLTLGTFDAPDDAALYDGVRTIRWTEHVGPDDTIAVDASKALKVKDAVVDQIRDEVGRRPSVDTVAPDLRINVHIAGGKATVSIDLSGDSLHRRGWRAIGVEAPLKENLAAAILALAEWPRHAEAAAPLVDPMCGSGTLPIEAALIAADVAPGIGRASASNAFTGWRGHVVAVWKRLLDEARTRKRPITSPLFGFDQDPRAVQIASENARRAGVADAIDFRVVTFGDAEPPTPAAGVVVMNPPYGERLGETLALAPLYEQIGSVLRHRFTGWDAFVLSSNPDLQKRIGLRAARRHVLFNGAIECRLLEFAHRRGRGARRRRCARARRCAARRSPTACARTSSIARSGRRARTCTAGASTTPISSSMPSPSTSTRPRRTCRSMRRRRRSMRRAPRSASATSWRSCPRCSSIARHRRLRSSSAAPASATATQCESLGRRGKKLTVREGGHRFLVNLGDYLDTGLFLDHRRIRAMIESLARGKSFLNLFAYAASRRRCYAAAGGARSSVSVDLSNTYIDWADENLALNRHLVTTARAGAQRRATSCSGARRARAAIRDADLLHAADVLQLEGRRATTSAVQRDRVDADPRRLRAPARRRRRAATSQQPLPQIQDRAWTAHARSSQLSTTSARRRCPSTFSAIRFHGNGWRITKR